MTIGLIGYRGSGKTTVGKMLAERLGRAFVDVDDLVVGQAGRTIKEIFEHAGEQAFRDIESQVVREVSRLKNAVISFGGGALDREENRLAVTQSAMRVIYLRCDPAELSRRIQGDPLTVATRPNLTKLGGGIDEIEAMLGRREPIWDTIIVATVDVTNLTPEEVVGRCVSVL